MCPAWKFADADRAHFPVCEQFFQGPVGVEGQVEERLDSG